MSIATRWLAQWKGSGDAARRATGGQLPDDLRASLAAEDTLFLEEGLRGSVTRSNTSFSGQVEVRLIIAQAIHVADLLRRLVEHD